MTHNSPINFKLTHFLLWIKALKKRPNFYTFERALVKICQILHVILESTSQFAFKFYINLQCNQTYLPCSFLAQTYSLVKSSLLKFKFSRFLSVRVKIRQIPRINFELTSHVLFECCIILHSDNTKLPCKF